MYFNRVDDKFYSYTNEDFDKHIINSKDNNFPIFKKNITQQPAKSKLRLELEERFKNSISDATYNSDIKVTSNYQEKKITVKYLNEYPINNWFITNLEKFLNNEKILFNELKNKQNNIYLKQIKQYQFINDSLIYPIIELQKNSPNKNSKKLCKSSQKYCDHIFQNNYEGKKFLKEFSIYMALKEIEKFESYNILTKYRIITNKIPHVQNLNQITFLMINLIKVSLQEIINQGYEIKSSQLEIIENINNDLKTFEQNQFKIIANINSKDNENKQIILKKNKKQKNENIDESIIDYIERYIMDYYDYAKTIYKYN